MTSRMVFRVLFDSWLFLNLKSDREEVGMIINYKYIKKIPSRLWMGQFILIF
ncbi:MAG: hypothetical protein ACRC8K_24525 [Waterburya sp.]